MTQDVPLRSKQLLMLTKESFGYLIVLVLCFCDRKELGRVGYSNHHIYFNKISVCPFLQLVFLVPRPAQIPNSSLY
jgi:hypothetical protein